MIDIRYSVMVALALISRSSIADFSWEEQKYWDEVLNVEERFPE